MDEKYVRSRFIIKVIPYETLRIITAVLLASAITAVFFGMALGMEGIYGSDSPAHISSGIMLQGYGLEAVFVYIISKFAGYPFLQFVFAVYQTILVMLTWGVSQKFIDKFFAVDKKLNLAISTGLIFLTTIYIPVIYPYFYKYGLGTQPWHNSTYFGMRLSAILYLYLLLQMLPQYIEKGISVFEAGGGGILLATTTIFKPNFLLTVCVSFAVLFLVDFGYSCAGVPLFRRNGYRQSSGRKPLFRNRDTALN